LKEHEIYLDVMPNEGEECDQGDKPELPRSRENIYLDVLSDERRIEAVDLQVQEHPPDLTTAADRLLHVWTRHIKITIKAATTKV